MEEGAPLDPSSGGTPTAMVAVPMLNSALGQRLSIFGGTGVGTKMEASIHLRAKDFAAHERWLANLADVITSNGLDDLWENQQLPTREAVARQFTDKTSDEQQQLLRLVSERVDAAVMGRATGGVQNKCAAGCCAGWNDVGTGVWWVVCLRVRCEVRGRRMLIRSGWRAVCFAREILACVVL